MSYNTLALGEFSFFAGRLKQAVSGPAGFFLSNSSADTGNGKSEMFLVNPIQQQQDRRFFR